MKTPRNATTDGFPLCPMCERGELQPETISFDTQADGMQFTVPDVSVERCSECGEFMLTPKGSRQVSEFIARATGALTQEELQQFLDQYELTQKEASRILNIGEKNFSRWLNGKQRVSGSMSNYIRTLTAHPEAFETLKKRQWGNPVQQQRFPAEERQPDEEEKTVLQAVDFRQLVKIGLVEATKKRDQRRTQLCRLGRSADLIQFQQWCLESIEGIAAYKDTRQQYSPVNGGLWVQLGERAAHALSVSPYGQDKLEAAVNDIRELTQHEPNEVFGSVQKRLAEAGVALVVIPKLDGSAYRGCTRLLHPAKAMIAHSLKYKNASQFWRVLFHEIAHLILHIETPEDRFDEYEDQLDDEREREADLWADEILVYGEKLVAFEARHKKPSLLDLARFAHDLKTSPAIVAEIINDRREENAFDYGHLRKEQMFPTITDDAVEAMWSVSRELILQRA